MSARRIPRTYREERESSSSPPRRSGATTTGPRLATRARTGLLRHAQTLIYALGQLSQRPLAMAMTVAVIGISLALPTALSALLENARGVLPTLEGVAQVSLFLKHGVAEADARHLGQRLVTRPDVAGVDYISPQQALAEFRRHSGLGQALDVLHENPLPWVLVLRPRSGGHADALVNELSALPEVDAAQVDAQWVARLHALVVVGQRAVTVLGALLATGVLLVVGNTIRLTVEARRDEIIIMKLLGATDTFIRRPFLYTGFWYGLLGGVAALLLAAAALLALRGPVGELASLYQSDLTLSGVGIGTALLVLVGSALLGLLGSVLAVGRHLDAIEPA